MEPNAPGTSTSSRATKFMMEGVGARVIRGPDWKWGKQVDLYNLFALEFNLKSQIAPLKVVYTWRHTFQYNNKSSEYNYKKSITTTFVSYI